MSRMGIHIFHNIMYTIIIVHNMGFDIFLMHFKYYNILFYN